jgi:hypothetical protein
VGIKPAIFKDTLVSSAIGAGSGWVLYTINDKIAQQFKLSGVTRQLVLLLTSAVAGGLTYKFTRNKSMSIAVGVGPIMIMLLQMLGKGAMFATQPGVTKGLGIVTGERAQGFEPLSQPPIGVVPASGLFAETSIV